MADSTRTGWSFAAGLMVGGAVALWASFAWLLPAMGPVQRPGFGAAEAPAPVSQLAPAEPAPAARTVAEAESVAAACGREPLLRPASARDGRFAIDRAAGGEPPALRGYLAAAREAARQGRSRDSEVALMQACRLAADTWPRVSVPVADVQSQLGQRYLDAAAAEPDQLVRTRILERAEGLLEQSLAAYSLVLGTDASKSRMAARRVAVLARLREPQGPVVTVAPGETLLLAPGPPGSTLATLGAGPQAWAGLAAPGGHDTAAASAAAAAVAVAALIRSDPELVRMESDLSRLQAQAASVTKDPEGLRQRSSQALAQRDAQCRDKPCLLRWYAQRKRELFAEF